MINKLNKTFKGLFSPSEKEIAIKINEIVDYLNNLVIPEDNHLVYTAFLSQSGTSAPTEVDIEGNASTPLEDTIEGVWTYSNTGLFLYTKTGMFTDATKILVNLGCNEQNQEPDITVLVQKVDNDTLSLKTKRASSFTGASFTAENGVLYIQPIEIRVYN